MMKVRDWRAVRFLFAEANRTSRSRSFLSVSTVKPSRRFVKDIRYAVSTVLRTVGPRIMHKYTACPVGNLCYREKENKTKEGIYEADKNASRSRVCIYAYRIGSGSNLCSNKRKIF